MRALEYNFFIPLFFGPWHIYPFFRKDRATQSLSWTFLEIFKAFGKIFTMGCFIELYLHCFPFITVGFDKQDWLSKLKYLKYNLKITSMSKILKLFLFMVFNLMQAISELSLTSIAGLIRAAIENFCFKYIVFYGIGSTWSKMVGISCPGGPSNHLFE